MALAPHARLLEPMAARSKKRPKGHPGGSSPPRRSRLQSELVQSRPFASPAEETFLNLQRTAHLLEHELAVRLEPFGLTTTQYNVLRILRGSPAGLPCGEIGRRMVTPVPDVTRLTDRLVKAGWVERRRPEEGDRRVVLVAITTSGLELLSRIDEPLLEWLSELLGHLGHATLEELSELLERARCPLVEKGVD
jgi:DNA-binding MarR family transcriptional regulator